MQRQFLEEFTLKEISNSIIIDISFKSTEIVRQEIKCYTDNIKIQEGKLENDRFTHTY